MINLAIKIKMSGTIDSPYRVLVITKPTRTGSASTAPSSGSATVPVPGLLGVPPAPSPGSTTASVPGSSAVSPVPSPPVGTARSGTAEEEFFDAPEPSVITPVFVPTEPTTAPMPPPSAAAVAPDDAVPNVPIFGPENEISLYLEMPTDLNKPYDSADDKFLGLYEINFEVEDSAQKFYKMIIGIDSSYFETNAAYRFIKIFFNDKEEKIRQEQSNTIFHTEKSNEKMWSKKAHAYFSALEIESDKILQEIFEFSTGVKNPSDDSSKFLLEKIEEENSPPASSRQIQALGDDSTDDDMPGLEETLDFQNADTLEESEGTPARMAEDLRRNKIREERLPRRKENVQKIKRFASKSPKTQQRITEGKFRKEQLKQKVQMKRQKREEKRERRLADRASTTEVGYTFH